MNNSNKLILLDVDNTLVDKEYNFTTDVTTLKKTLKKLIEKGLQIGLNSDSAISTLQNLSDKLELSGPIVAEKGAIVLFEGNKRCIDIKTRRMKNVYEGFLSMLFEECVLNKKLAVCTGNINPLFKALKGLKAEDRGLDTLVLVNGTRESSFSFYCMERRSNSWDIRSEKLREFAEKALLITQKFYNISDLDVDINPDYGICIIHHKKTSKLGAIPYLQKLFPNNKIYMVGDSMSDFHDSSITHCAVGNATKEYKAKAKHVTKSKITEGVIDALKWIDKQV